MQQVAASGTKITSICVLSVFVKIISICFYSVVLFILMMCASLAFVT